MQMNAKIGPAIWAILAEPVVAELGELAELAELADLVDLDEH